MASTSSGSGETPEQAPSILSPEIQERIRKNREEALKKLRAKGVDIPAVTSGQPGQGLDLGASLKTVPGQGHSQSQSEVPPPPPKKRKTAQEERLYNDLQDCIHRGTTVRVQGSKLIDTGGGFLLEEKDLIEEEMSRKEIVKDRAPFLDLNCEECQKEFPDSYLLKNFDLQVCDSCRDQDNKHKLITRTDAKNEFFLKDADFDRREPRLRFLSRPNPHNSHWGDMKLYLRCQIEERAIEVWGSLEKIESEREIREENRVKSKIKKYNKKMNNLRKEARSSLYKKVSTAHVHSWGEETYDEEEDVYSHRCTECDQEETYEKM